MRLHVHHIDFVILTQEMADSSLSVGFSTQDEAVDVARSTVIGRNLLEIKKGAWGIMELRARPPPTFFIHLGPIHKEVFDHRSWDLNLDRLYSLLRYTFALLRRMMRRNN